MDRQCDRAATIKATLGSTSGILILTSESWVSEPVQPACLQCSGIDVIPLRVYVVGDFAMSNLQTYVNEAPRQARSVDLRRPRLDIVVPRAGGEHAPIQVVNSYCSYTMFIAVSWISLMGMTLGNNMFSTLL